MLNAATQLTRGTGATKQYGFASTVLQAQDVSFFLEQFGASTTPGSGDSLQPNFTDPQVLQALRFYLNLLRTTSPHTRLRGYTPNDVADEEAIQLVQAGRVGLWFDFSASFTSFGGFGTKEVPRAIAPPPFSKGAATLDDFRVRGMYISAQSQHPEACWFWMKYLSNYLEGLGGGFPARLSIARSAAFTNKAPQGAATVYPAYQMAFARASSQESENPQDQQVVDLYWFFRAIDRSLQGGDLKRELAAAQATTEQFLNCVRGGKPGERARGR